MQNVCNKDCDNCRGVLLLKCKERPRPEVDRSKLAEELREEWRETLHLLANS